MTWTSTRPKPPYAWRSLVNDTKGIVLTVDEARDLGLVYPAEFCQLPPVPARKTAMEELREALRASCETYPDEAATPTGLRVRRAIDCLLAEPEIDADRLRRAIKNAGGLLISAEHIAAAYERGGAS